MLRDIVYEELDELSKMVEPYLSHENENLVLIPDEIDVTFDDIYNVCVGETNLQTLNIADVIARRCKDPQVQKYLSKVSLSDLRKFFTLQVEDGEELEVNLENRTMSHRLILTKNKEFLTEEEIKEKCLNSLRFKMGGMSNSKYFNKKRANEIADLFGAKQVRRERGWRGKYHYLKKHMATIVDDGTLDIRHVDLCSKVGEWITKYIRDGNLAAFKNLTKVKIMSHEKRAIYSIQEEGV